MTTDSVSIDRFKVMERKLFYGIMNPGAVLTIFTGLWLLYEYGWQLNKHAGWLHAKLLLVTILIAYHIYCGYLLIQFKYDKNTHSHVFYRWLNEFPVLILIGIVVMVVVRPF